MGSRPRGAVRPTNFPRCVPLSKAALARAAACENAARLRCIPVISSDEAIPWEPAFNLRLWKLDKRQTLAGEHRLDLSKHPFVEIALFVLLF